MNDFAPSLEASAYLEPIKNEDFEFIRESKNMLFFLEAFTEIESWGALYLFKYMQDHKIFESQEKCYHRDDIRASLHVLPYYFRLLESLLEILVKQGYIFSPKPQRYQASYSRFVTQAEIMSQKNILLKKHPEHQVNIDFLAAVFARYSEIISGRESFLTIMFPNGSFEIIEHLYKNNPDAAYYNRLTAAVIANYAKQYLQKNATKLTLLEIGAGLASTTSQILPLLKEHQLCEQYHYTDISKAFTQYGKRNLGQQFDFMSFQPLNIEQEPSLQGFTLHHYDIILATNVLHATADILKVLKYVKSLLKPGGLLVLNEGIFKRDYATLVYGLATGWWTFLDEEWRISGSPFITLVGWKTLLQHSGFDQVFSLNQFLNLEGQIYQDVIVARNLDNAPNN